MDESRILQRVARAAALSEPGLAGEITSAALALCPRAQSAGFSIELPDGRFRWFAVCGALSGAPDDPRPTDEPCSRAVQAAKTLLFLNPAAKWPARAHIQPKLCEELHVPVLVSDAVRGTLWLASHQPGECFGPEDIRRAELLAGYAALVLSREAERALGNEFTAELDRFRRIAGKLHDVVWIASVPERRFLYVSSGVESLRGITPDAVMDRFETWWDTVCAEDRERVRTQLLQALDQGRYDVEYRVMQPNAGVRWIHERAVPAGWPGQLAGISDDVTEWKLAETELHYATQRVQRQIEISPMAFVEFSPEGAIITWSSNAERLFGWTSDEMVGRATAADWVHPEDLASVLSDSANLVSGQVTTTVSENRNIRKDGSVVWCEWHNSALVDEHGRITSLISFVLDVTERRKTERALRESQQRLDLAQTAAGIGTFESLIPEGRVVWTESLERLFGLEPGAFEGSIEDWKRRVVPEDLRRINRTVRNATEQRRTELEYEFHAILPTGEHRLLYTRGRLSYDQRTGEAIRLLGICMDITEQRRVQSERERLLAEARLEIRRRHQVERKLRQSNDDLQQFAWSASHDMQEPLRTVALYSELLRRRYAGRIDAEADRFLGFINGSAHRMENLLRDLLAYSRVATEPHVERQDVDSREVLSEVLGQLRTVIDSTNARIHIGPLPRVRVWRVHLHQLFQNLIGNALKYRGDRQPEIYIGAETAGGLHTFFVRDNGIGIDSQYYHQIFGIFRRLHTQDAYPGTGMGLAICQKIVERYGGSIWVQSEPRQGSTFRFAVPETAEEPASELRTSSIF